MEKNFETPEASVDQNLSQQEESLRRNDLLKNVDEVMNDAFDEKQIDEESGSSADFVTPFESLENNEDNFDGDLVEHVFPDVYIRNKALPDHKKRMPSVSENMLQRKNVPSAGDQNKFDERQISDDIIIKSDEYCMKQTSDDDEASSSGCLLDKYLTPLDSLFSYLSSFYKEHWTFLKYSLLIILFLTYNIFLVYCVVINWNMSASYCSDVKKLVVATILVYIVLLFKYLINPYYIPILKVQLKPCEAICLWLIRAQYLDMVLYSIFTAGFLMFMIKDTVGQRSRFVPVAGLVIFIILGVLFSKAPNKIQWRTVLNCVIIQLSLGFIFHRWGGGKEILSCLQKNVKDFLSSTHEGGSYVFGYLVDGSFIGFEKHRATYAFEILPEILYFNFFVTILYYLGFMQWFIRNVGWFINKLIGTTRLESVNVLANIFLGQSEAALIVEPYLKILTKSELHTIMTGGFATMGVSVTEVYLGLGIPAGHLVLAAFLSAPAAVAYSKLLYPELEKPETEKKIFEKNTHDQVTFIEAGLHGARTGVILSFHIAVNLIAFYAFIHLVNDLILWQANMVDLDKHIGHSEFTMQFILSKLLYPVAFMIGVEKEETEQAARLISLKFIFNEYVAYKELSKMLEDGLITHRGAAIATYALCGFGNLGNVGVVIGDMASICLGRMKEMTELVLRALVAGTVACFMTACVAGIYIRIPEDTEL